MELLFNFQTLQIFRVIYGHSRYSICLYSCFASVYPNQIIEYNSLIPWRTWKVLLHFKRKYQRFLKQGN